MSTLITLSLVACSSPSLDEPNDAAKNETTKEEKQSNEVHTTHWTYEGETAPEHWGDINPDYEACAVGQEQSPINIEATQIIEDEKNLRFGY